MARTVESQYPRVRSHRARGLMLAAIYESDRHGALLAEISRELKDSGDTASAPARRMILDLLQHTNRRVNSLRGMVGPA